MKLSQQVFTSRSTNTSDEARADVRAAGFWTRGEDAYFDVRVFHPNALSYATKTLPALFDHHGRQKFLE